MPRTSTKPAQPPAINLNISSAAPSPEPEKPPVPEEKPDHWFFTHIWELPQHEWGKIWSMELYRLKPDVPGVPGTKGYLRVFNEPITKEMLRTSVGGGRFKLNLCKNGRWSTSHEFEIVGEPIYDFTRERPHTNGNSNSSGANADFQKEFIGVLREELARSRDAASGATAGSDAGIAMIVQAAGKAMEIVKDQLPKATSAASEMREMVLAMKDMGIIGQQQPQKTLVEQIMDLLQHPTLGAKILELFAPKNPLDQLTQLGSLMEVVEKLRGNSGGDPKDWRAAAVQTIGSHLPEILDTLKAGPANNAAAAQARAQEAAARARAAEVLTNTQQRQPQPAPRPETPNPAAPAQPSAAPAAPTLHVQGGLHVVSRVPGETTLEPIDISNAAPAPTPIVTAPPATREEYDAAMKTQVVNMLRMGASGSAIASFIEDIKPEFADQLTQFSHEQITSFFRADPILQLAVNDDRWETVLAEAIEYLSEEEPAPVN